MTAVFEREFAQALFSPHGDETLALAAQPAFAVYRNTVMRGCIDALEGNFPAVVRLVGRDWFRSAAALHVAESPPRDPRLLFYGDDFPQFLARFEPAGVLPYLPAVAALDRAWTQSHGAADATPLSADALRALPPDTLGALRLRPHPAARWHWCAEHPAHTIWSCNRGDDTVLCDDLPWVAEGTLIVRPFEIVEWHALDRAGWAFLGACARGDTLADAAAAALDADAQADIAALLARLVGQGAFDARSLPLTETP